MVKNDDEVVAGLRSLESRSWASGATVRFRDVDFNLLSFEEQIDVSIQTDVMVILMLQRKRTTHTHTALLAASTFDIRCMIVLQVGPHGAGLMHNIFAPDRAALIELHIDNSDANQHFHNLARWQGRKYKAKKVSNPINVRDLTETVAAMVASVDISTY